MNITLFNPLFWITLCFCLSLIFKKARAKKLLRNASFALFFLFTNNWVSDLCFHLWEYETIEVMDISEPYDIGIVLGPFLFDGAHLPNGQAIVRGENYRFTQAIQLYQKGKFEKFLLSGNDNIDSARDHLMSLCIPAEDILIEGKSNDTYENALFSDRFLSQAGILTNRILLITTASHMRRARKCFKKVGLEVTPFSVDYWTSCADVWSFSINAVIPNYLACGKWKALFREWASMLYFKIKNYI